MANPGTWTFRATGGSEHTSRMIKLVPNCIHTIVILDDSGHLKIDDLLDTAGAMEMPVGGVNTGLGGAAARGTSPMPWLAIIVGGGFLTAVGMIRLRRTRSRTAHAAIDR